MLLINKRKTVIVLIVLSIALLFMMGCERHVLYTLTMERDGHGFLDPGLGNHSIQRGTIVEVTAESSEGWEFKKWIGQVADTKSPETKIVINEDTTLKAVFEVKEEYPIEFEDENLEEAVRIAIDRMDGDLFLEDVIDLESLDAIGLGIVSLEGIQHLYNLKKLNVGYDGYTLESNDIEDISPLENLIYLEELQLGSNEIANIDPLSNLIHLEVLDLFQNEVEDIKALEHLVELRSLILSRNQINDINALEKLYNLEELYFDINNVSDISPIANLAELKTLIMRRNLITDISCLENLIHLEFLSFDRNQVEDISVLENLTHLDDLRFTGNLVTDISVLENLHNLNRLIFPQNKVRDISPLVNNEGFDSVLWVDMRNNFLDLTEGSQNMKDIETLQQRVEILQYEPQREPEE